MGISEEQLRRAARSAVLQINIDSDGRLAMTVVLRKVLLKRRNSNRATSAGPEVLIKMVR